ncbi:MAG: HDOD domain-containing protein [Deltaproteobacteria bacterium]|nr:HDOD domain-containing protein [Deltaproteobacteria bacterium]
MDFEDYPDEARIRAEFIVDERFRLNDRKRPLVEALYQASLRFTAERLVNDPDFWGRYGRERQTALDFRPTGEPVHLSLKNLRLPVLPQAGIELQQVMDNPNFTADDLAAVISKDPKLTTTMLRMVNSALYNLRQTVTTVSRSVALLGSQQVWNLALGTLMLNLFKQPANMRFDIQGYWRHCVACGILAKALATRARMPDPERFFVAGMLHDIGQLALLTASPEVMEVVQTTMFTADTTTPEVERRILTFDHMQLGARMSTMWSLPEFIHEAISMHHRPGDTELGSAARAVHLAENMAKVLTFGTGEGFVLDPLHEESWRSMGIGIQDLDAMLAEATEKILGMTELLASMH